jgi:hypothetical protein
LHAATVPHPVNLLIYPYSRARDPLEETDYQENDFTPSDDLTWSDGDDGMFTIYTNVCNDLIKMIPGFDVYLYEYINVFVTYDIRPNHDEQFAAANHAVDILQQLKPSGYDGPTKTLLAFKDIGGGQATSFAAYGSAHDMLCNTYPDDTPAYHNVAGDA